MEKIKIAPKYIAVGTVILAVADTMFMVLGAVLIEKKLLSFDSINIWALASLIMASCAASLFCSSRTGVPMNAYPVVGLCFLLLVLLPMVTFSVGISLMTAVKELTALICGAFIGNFFGMSRHNRLRKIGKKKRFNTK